MVPSCTTCVTYISAAHIKHLIAIAPFQRGVRRTHPSCVSFEDQARVASRQAATMRTSKPHQVGPDAGQGRVVNVKLKVNRLPALRAPSNEIAHRVARNSQEKESNFLEAFLLLGRLHRAS